MFHENVALPLSFFFLQMYKKYPEIRLPPPHATNPPIQSELPSKSTMKICNLVHFGVVIWEHVASFQSFATSITDS